MRNKFVGAATGAALVLAHAGIAQSSKKESVIPLRELSAPEVQTLPQFASIASVREMSTGNVMVNDATRHQLVVFDHALTNPSVGLDSATLQQSGFGFWFNALVPFSGDSSLFGDVKTRSLIVLDATGKFSRQINVPNMIEFLFMSGARGVDARNNLIYTSQIGGLDFREMRAAAAAHKLTATVMRINLKRQDREVVGQVSGTTQMSTLMDKGPNGESVMRMILNPLAIADDWAVLSDGSIAFVFGEDYHVEMRQPNGKALAATTIPFGRRAVTNAEKLAIEDSVRASKMMAFTSDDANPMSQLAIVAAGVHAAGQAGISRTASGTGFGLEVRKDANGVQSGTVFKGDQGDNRAGLQIPFSVVQPAVEFVPLNEMSDTYPAFFPNAAKPDLDAKLWIRTTASAPGHPGDALYDVLDNRGELVQRVRVPADRTIVGFGRGGVVYLKHLDGTQQWALERVKVLQ